MTNIVDDVVCPGEELILTCIDEGTSQRWNVRKENGDSTEVTFLVRSSQVGTRHTWNLFTWTVISTNYNHFESTLSMVVTNVVNNTVVECSGEMSLATATIRIAGQQAYVHSFLYYYYFKTMNLQMSLLHLKILALDQ